jgi:hypothetical protein
MRKFMEQLIALQKLQFGPQSGTTEAQAQMEQLRQEIPAPILAHYERLVLRGKKGVAVARNGVCSECHLRITVGKLAGLIYTDEASLCDNCGRYLYLPEDEPVGWIENTRPITPAPKRPPRPARAPGL